MPCLRVGVIGAGIGGLTAAIAMARKGVDVTVMEEAPELPAVGASLQLGPNALRLMGRLGLLPELRRVGVRPDAVELLRWDNGSLLLHTELGAAAEAYFGAPQLDFYRPDIHRVLVGAVPQGTLLYGMSVTGAEQDDNGVEVSTASGERLRFDAVVAADGIRSPTRQRLVGTDEPVFAGTVVYRGVVAHAKAKSLQPDYVNRYWIGPYRHGVSYRISAGNLLAVNCAIQHAEWAQESWTIKAPAEEAMPYFEGWEGSLLERIRLCGTMLRGAVFVRRPIDHWAFGRVALLGDAAHAMEPFQAQGAAQAVEDAFVLAECLNARGPDEVAAAFEQYEDVRMTRARVLQESSHLAADSFYLPDGEAQRARDAGYASLHETQPWGVRQAIWEHDVSSDLSL
ncbi:MAG: FAD-dependent monooxygenase [Acidimicrobiales bacterium]